MSKKEYALAEVVAIVAQKNGYPAVEQQRMLDVAKLVKDHIPPDVRHLCSYYMVQDRRYFNFKITNYWVLACPMYDCDCALLWLGGLSPPSTVSDGISRLRYGFARVDSVLLAMDYDEILEMNADDWDLFQDACIETARLRDRMWKSNIRFDE